MTTAPFSPGPGAGPAIVVAGEALVDLIVRADGGIVPVAGGSPYNMVRAIARLGVAAAWAGGLSSDRFGRMLEAGLADDGVDLSAVQRTDRPTTLALAELATDGSASYRFYTAETSSPAVYPGPLAGVVRDGVRAFATGSLGLVLGPMADTLERVATAVPADRLVMLDPNARPSITADPDAWRARVARVMARADIVKASTEDLAYLRPGETVDEAVDWVAAHGPRVILVTDGAQPVRVVSSGESAFLPAPPVEVVDTVGAGDTFGGAFLACLVHEGVGPADLGDRATILRAARFALRASAAVCGRAGANPPSLHELGGWPAA